MRLKEIILWEGVKNLDLKEELHNIITDNKIRSVFQPIISLKNGEILGYEALSRGPVGSKLEKPAKLFEVAKKYHLLFQLDRLCRENALKKAKELNNKYKIFINIDPLVIFDEEFEEGITRNYLQENCIDQSNVVIELTEKTSFEKCNGVKNILSHYQKQGYNIAIDDAGAGYSGLQSIVSISHNYIKIDRSLIHNIDKNNIKQSLIEAFMNFAESINSEVIAEGIETKAELNTLINLGVDYGQGYYLAYPEPGFRTQFNITDDDIIKINNNGKSGKAMIGHIASKVVEKPITLQTKISEVVDIFEDDSDLNRIVVIKNNKPVGLVMRDKLYYRLGTRFGYSIYMQKSIETVMNKKPMIVDFGTPVTRVSKKAMNRKKDNIYDSIIVTVEGKYYGTVSIRDLLMRVSKLKIEEAKSLNPLTNLSGNPVIEREINRRIKNGELFSVLYIDLDNFKAYNDNYGYKKGDSLIKMTADVLRNSINKYEDNDDFIGHIGGDDFVIVTIPDRDINISETIINNFDKKVVNFFNEMDIKNGYMVGRNRQGKSYHSPLTTISIAIVSNEDVYFKNHLQVSDKMVEIKKYVKDKSGSNYMKDRRKESLNLGDGITVENNRNVFDNINSGKFVI